MTTQGPVTGLTAEEVERRRTAGQTNQPPHSATKTVREIVRDNVCTYFNLVFLLLAMALAMVGSYANMTFLGVVVCNTVIGIVQQLRSKKAVDELTLVAARRVRCLRAGRWEEVLSNDLVKDDVVEFGSGDQICADAVILEGHAHANEALITGEERAVPKGPGEELRSGSFLMNGQCVARLTAVGADSYAHRLTAAAQADGHRVPKGEMMRSLDRLIRLIGIALVPLGAVLFYKQYKLLAMTPRTSVEGTVAALVGMIPEGLYLLTSVALAVSTQKLSRKRVLVQDWNCIEALARVDVLCVDKTGTITEPKMEVENLIPLTALSPERLQDMLTAMYGCGEPDNATADAMAELFSGETSLSCTKRIPFSPETKWSGCTFDTGESLVVGAPEYILGSRFGQLQEEISAWTEQGYRVLLAAQYTPPLAFGKLQEDALTPLALILLNSPLREGARETFEYFARQGVSIRVISGDSPATASRVAMDAGIPGAEN